MIDLHTHTVYSDGSSSVEELLTRAQALGLTTLSITDHNAVGAYQDPAMEHWHDLYHGTILPGIEITCMLEGEIVEVLGYGFELPLMCRQLKGHVLTFREKQLRESELVIAALQKAGARFDPARLAFDPDRESCRKAVLALLKEDPANRALFSSEKGWENSRGFTRLEIYNPASPLYVDESPLYPTAAEAVEMIHASHGIALMAHLFLYAHAESFFRRLAVLQPELGLDGMECRHSAFTPEQAQRLEMFCREHHLLCSGGSDFHGTRKPDVRLGNEGGLTIPEAFLNSWPRQVLARAIP